MTHSSSSAQKPAAERVPHIIRLLYDLYPGATCSLHFQTPLQLLIATILSAQCTDDRVNLVTPALFAKYPDAATLANAPLEDLEAMIRSTGFYHNKAKNILGMARMIADTFHGEVPQSMDELLRLPGVARKTANVVQGNAFGIVTGIVVDTHVTRLANRLGLTQHDDAVKIEKDLIRLFDKQDWLPLSHMFIYHGRAICKAQKPACGSCALQAYCPTGSSEV